MNYENQLAIDSVLPCLQNRVDLLLPLIQKFQKTLAHAPKGRLRLSKHGKHVHCYHVTSSKNSSGVYIPNEEADLIRKLAQKDYDERILQELERELTILDKAIADFSGFNLNEIWMNIPDFRKRQIRPIFLQKDEFIRQWLDVTYTQKPFAEDAPVLTTSRGERVRSKSEVIIADTLARLGIPYRYEFPLKLKKNKSQCILVHPDFTCLNVRLRREFLWEHLGMMDSPDYAHAAILKMTMYRDNGYFEGERLILSMEASDNPLSPQDVEILAREFLL